MAAPPAVVMDHGWLARMECASAPSVTVDEKKLITSFPGSSRDHVVAEKQTARIAGREERHGRGVVVERTVEVLLRLPRRSIVVRVAKRNIGRGDAIAEHVVAVE
jgi:hypothetical protein